MHFPFGCYRSDGSRQARRSVHAGCRASLFTVLITVTGLSPGSTTIRARASMHLAQEDQKRASIAAAPLSPRCLPFRAPRQHKALESEAHAPFLPSALRCSTTKGSLQSQRGNRRLNVACLSPVLWSLFSLMNLYSIYVGVVQVDGL